MSASISFTDSVGAAVLVNAYPAPADRFSNWTPMTRPVGDSTTCLGTGATVMFVERTDYGASFDFEGLPVLNPNASLSVSIADRLIAWAMQGGTFEIITNDHLGSAYGTCGLWPGSTPTLKMTDRKNFLFTLSMQVVNLGSATQMVAQYVT